MFGEVMGKTKNQLRREVLMMRLRQLKRHIPAIAGAVGTIAATAIAVHYKNELEKTQQFNDYEAENAWPTVEVTPNCFKEFEAGATLQVRAYSPEDEGGTYIQMTTRDNGFPDEANEHYAKGTPGFSKDSYVYDDKE